MKEIQMTEEQTKSERNRNYDFLRIVCTIAVIMIHVSGSYKSAYMDINEFGNIYKDNLFITCVFNSVSRFAVPCFVMLSGCFILADRKNADYNFFWRKKMKKLGIPTMLFRFGYCFYQFIIEMFCSGGGIEGSKKMWQLLMRFTKGIPFYHMWYMYMLIGICFLAPFFVRIAAEIPPKDFEKITCVFTVWASLSSCTSQYLLAWDLGKAALYMGYFMFGHVIYERTRNKKNNFRGVCLIMGGIMIELMMAYISYVHVLNGIAEKDEFYAVILPQSPWIVCASIVIFGGFSLLDIKWDFGKLPACTFYIYLFHAGVWDIVRRIMKKYGLPGINGSFQILQYIIVVFLISAIFSAGCLSCTRRLQSRGS